MQHAQTVPAPKMMRLEIGARGKKIRAALAQLVRGRVRPWNRTLRHYDSLGETNLRRNKELPYAGKRSR